MYAVNDNSNDFVTNLFKLVPVTKNHYYNQKFRQRALDKFERYLHDACGANYRALRSALVDVQRYQKESLVHPLDLEV